MDKIKLFLKKYGLIVLIGLLVLACLFSFIFSFISKKPLDEIMKVADKARKNLDKTDTEIKAKQIETEVKTKMAEKEQKEILSKLEYIKTIENPDLRRRKVIELHDKIKKFK